MSKVILLLLDIINSNHYNKRKTLKKQKQNQNKYNNENEFEPRGG